MSSNFSTPEDDTKLIRIMKIQLQGKLFEMEERAMGNEVRNELTPEQNKNKKATISDDWTSYTFQHSASPFVLSINSFLFCSETQLLVPKRKGQSTFLCISNLATSLL